MRQPPLPEIWRSNSISSTPNSRAEPGAVAHFFCPLWLIFLLQNRKKAQKGRKMSEVANNKDSGWHCVPEPSEEDFIREVWDEETNKHIGTLYRCSCCWSHQKPEEYDERELDDDNHLIVCKTCRYNQEVRNRWWHSVKTSEDHNKQVHSFITGKFHAKLTTQHFFRCIKCRHDKAKSEYNYSEAAKAMFRREQPTCASCLPELPKDVAKLKMKEMKFYLQAWSGEPVKKGIKKEELREVFRAACKQQIKGNLFKKPKQRAPGLKDLSKQRKLDSWFSAKKKKENQL